MTPPIISPCILLVLLVSMNIRDSIHRSHAFSTHYGTFPSFFVSKKIQYVSYRHKTLPSRSSAYHKDTSLLLSSSSNGRSVNNTPTHLNGKVVFPIKTIVAGLQSQSIQVAAVYAVLNQNYKRGSGDGWEHTEYIAMTKDLQYALDSHIAQNGPEVVAYVRALSFAFPQKSVMEDIVKEWKLIASQYQGPTSTIDSPMKKWDLVPNISASPSSSSSSSIFTAASTTTTTMTTSASTTVISTDPSVSIHDPRTQQMVEFIRAVQYDEDDSDDEDEDEDHDDSSIPNRILTIDESVVDQQITDPTDIQSPFLDPENQSSTSPPVVAKNLELNQENVDTVLNEVRPFLIRDGGNVSVQRVDTEQRNIYLILEGACGSCASSTVTMQLGIERTLRERFSDLGQIVQVSPDSTTNGDTKPKELTVEAVQAELKRISPALTAMGATVELVSVDPIGVVEIKYRGSTKIQQGVELALRDVPYVKHVRFL